MPGTPTFIPSGALQRQGSDWRWTLRARRLRFEAVQNQHLEQGRFLTDTENSHRLDVAVIGHDLANTLFPAKDAIGKDLQVTGMTFRVIGVLEKSKGVFLRDSSCRQAGVSCPTSPI